MARHVCAPSSMDLTSGARKVAGEGETKVQERLLAHSSANPNDSHW